MEVMIYTRREQEVQILFVDWNRYDIFTKYTTHLHVVATTNWDSQ